MAKPMTADQLLAALKKWKVRYREYPGWRTRTRPGGITNASGIVIHHTGGGSASASYLKFLFVTGRPEDGIPGPLCNVATAPDGVLHIGAVGRANHAGSGSRTTLAHVQAEDYSGYGAELRPGPDGINGNEFYYGDEIIYTGATAPTDAAYQTAVLHAAAVCDFHGWTALSVIAHREHTGRKNDPGKIALNRFRTDLAAVLRIGPDVIWSGKTPKQPTSNPPAPSGDDVTTPNDIVGTNDDGTPMTMGQLSARMNLLYKWHLDNGKIGAAVKRIDAELADGGDTDAQLDRIEADTDAPKAP